MTWLMIALIRVYQLTLSKVLVFVFGPVCRFEPSCSRYAVLCLQGHGVLRGSLLSVKRLCRCHPFHPGGYDPPPPPSRGVPSKLTADLATSSLAAAPQAPFGEREGERERSAAEAESRAP